MDNQPDTDRMTREEIIMHFLNTAKTNLHIVGVYEIDIPKLRDAVKSFVRDSIEPYSSCSTLTYTLASRMLDTIKWEKVLELWYTLGTPASRHEIVREDWVYYYDNQDGGGDPSNRVIVHNPEWVGKECGDCCYAVEHFRKPVWR